MRSRQTPAQLSTVFMILSFTAIDKSTQLREFFCQQEELEEALELLNSIASQGDRILHAHLLDGKSYLELPVDVFDGEPLRAPLKELENQWQEALNELVSSPEADNSWYIELTRKRIQLYEDRINHFLNLIQQIERLRRQTECQMQSEQLQAKLISRYDDTLSKYRQYIDLARAGQQQALRKLKPSVY